MSDPNNGIVGRVWAVLSIRNILKPRDVLATANCSLFTSEAEAVLFAKRVADTKKNWVIRVAQVPVFSNNTAASLPEPETPFNEN